MNQKTFFSIFKFLCSPLFHSYIILFSHLTRTTLCSVDPKFQACEPKTCGNGPNISYPFYIQGKQESFCGNPGFEVSCAKNGLPILNPIGDDYIIHQIFYNNQSLRVSNPEFSKSSTNECIGRTHNVTVGKNRFSLGSNRKELLLFYGCDLASLPEGMREHRIGCSAENKTTSVLAFYRENQNLRLALNNCKGGVVKATVEDYGFGGIEEALKRGFVLNWKARNCSVCTNSGGRCGFDADPQEYTFKCYCPDRVHLQRCHSESKKLRTTKKLGIGVGLPSILIIGLLLVLYKRKSASSGGQFDSNNNYSDPSSNQDVESGIVYFGVPLFSYKELEEATSNFDHTKEIGDGGFGTVYYGKLQDGREVAVKRLYEHNYRRVEQFMNEVQILTRLRHKNLVSLYGCTSRHSRELLLVYEYIPNGTVAGHLHGEPAKPGLLPWSTRLKIAIETASALAYLHASDIIHRDVKTNNILLDNSFCVKVADFGLSRLFPNDVTHVSTAPQGTPGYVDPEYYQCYQLTNKSDVYSFGVVLIQLISSKPAVDLDRNKDEVNLSNLAIKKIQQSALGELVDLSLGFDSDGEVKKMVVSVAELAFQCLQRDKELRPSMDEVLEVLKRIESGKYEGEVVGATAGVSHSNEHVHPPPSISPEWDQVGLLKTMKLPSSPITVIDKWESKSTTHNVTM